MPRSPRLTITALLVSVATLCVACGGGAEEATSSVPSTSAASDPSTTGATSPPTAARASAGCGSAGGGSTLNDRRTVDVGGADRWYLLSTPPANDGRTPLPLVLDFHGLAEGAELHAGMSRFPELGQQEGFVVAVPNGTGTPAAWSIAADESSPDVAFVDALIDRIGADVCIDMNRVYAAGLSNGALLSSALACVRADRIAAISAVAGVQFPPGCDPTRNVPVLAFHGTADPILLFNGGVGDLAGALSGIPPTVPPGSTPDVDGPGTPAAMRSWAESSGCDPDPKDDPAGPSITRRTYSCPDGTAVEFYIVDGGGHAWPGSEFSQSIANIVGPTTMDLDATATAWEFFRSHPIAG